MVEVTKSILIKGNYGLEYTLLSEGDNAISVYARETGEPFDYDSPLLYLSNDEAKAMARALGELATGY